MAEQVQAILDGMVAPLRDLEERGVFSAEEIHAIVERRRTSEYALRRRQARKADFIEYIQNEINLEKLRELRVKRLKRQQPRSDHRAGGGFIGDKHIRSHIHLIWTRTLRKFRSDMTVYLLYADYLTETKNWNKLSLLYAQALQIFPRVEGLWIRAASHEFFQAGNIQSARVLLQRGLRINGSAEDLWIQSFVLELHIVQKFQGREAILRGEQEATEDVGCIDEDHPLTLVKLVYDHAVKRIPDKVAFRLRFIDQCRLFPSTIALVQHIVESITSDCGNQAEAWIAKAMYLKTIVDGEPGPSLRKKQRNEHGNVSSTNNSVLMVLRDATRALPTSAMYCQAIHFLQELLAEAGDEKEAVVDFGNDLFKQASDAGLLSSDLVLAYVEIVGASDEKTSMALAIDTYLKTSKNVPAEIWLRFAAAASSLNDAADILIRAVRETSMAKSDYLVLLLQLLGAKLKQHELIEVDNVLRFQESITYLAAGFSDLRDIDDPPFGVRNVMDACRQSLDYIFQRGGLSDARKAYANVLFQSNVPKLFAARSLDDVKAYIDMVLRVEDKCQDPTDRSMRLARIYQYATELFEGTELSKEYHKLSAHENQDR